MAARSGFSTLALMTLICGCLAVPQAAAWQPAQPGNVRLNLQGEVKLQALIDYVSQRLNLQIIYSANVGNKRVNVRAPQELPVESLLPLLSAVLKSEKLALVDADLPGFKRIVDAKDMLGAAMPGDPETVLKEQGAATPVIHAFVLEYTNAQQLSTILRPFLTQPGSSLIALPENNVLVVTDYSRTVLQVARLIEMIDRPRGDASYEFYEVQHVSAASLAEQIRTMLGARDTEAGAAQSVQAPRGQVELFEEPRTNQIVVAGPPELVKEALTLLKRFDVSLGLVTQVYRFRHIQAERFNKLAQGFLAARDTERVYSASVDVDGNLLIVQATPEIHQRLAELLRQVDVPVEVQRSPIRFYKLKNANVLDVLYSLLALQDVGGMTSTFFGARVDTRGGGFGPAVNPVDPLNPVYPQPNLYRRDITNQSPFSGMQGTQGAQGMQGTPGQPNRPMQLPLSPDEDVPGVYEQEQDSRMQRLGSAFGDQLGFGATALLPGGARVSADPTSNSLIVVAPPEVQEMYKGLIEQLDQRKPQVLIDAKIVAVDTSDSFELGVEISGGDRSPIKRLFAFTSYGLSQVDPVTGSLLITPSIGFNGTLVDPDVADVVVQALSTHSRARVLASPRILVNDNSTGQLESVASVPFASVNASNTVSTTSLGGNQTAGTIITVTPHINENDHLLLEFEIEFSTFLSSDATQTLPPPRQIDRVGSTVTVPDGKTVIVGGLRRTGNSKSIAGIPGLVHIPIIRDVTSLQTKDKSTTSFFLFIRPLILRDDKFADLRYVSRQSARLADIPAPHPRSRPSMIDDEFPATRPPSIGTQQLFTRPAMIDE